MNIGRLACSNAIKHSMYYSLFLALSLLGSTAYASTAAEARTQIQLWTNIANQARAQGQQAELNNALENIRMWEALANPQQGNAPAAPQTSATPQTHSPPVDPARQRQLQELLSNAISRNDQGRALNFIDSGARPTPQLLQMAIDNGSIGMAQLLIRHGAEVDKTMLGRALLRASNNRQAHLIQGLITLGADPNFSENERTALDIAVANGHTELIPLLTQSGGRLNTAALGMAVYEAVEQGNTERVRGFLQVGVNANYTREGVSLLALALRREDFATAAVLVNGGARIEKEELGKLLFKAVEQNNINQVNQVISMGADINTLNSNNMNPLSLAIAQGNLGLAEQLIRAGADDSTRRYASRLFDAALAGDTNMLRVLSQVPSYQNYRNADSESPLHAAASRGHVGAVRLLLAAGISPNITTAKNWTPLHHAARFGHDGALRELLQAGANVYAVNSDGNDAYRLAALALRDSSINSRPIISSLNLWMQYRQPPQTSAEVALRNAVSAHN